MGQGKSKNWRRLSESDCAHLLNDDELNNQSSLFPPSTFTSSDFKFHTITNSNKWPPNKHNANLPEDIFIRNRSGSACGAPSSEATLLKFSKFETGDFVHKPSNYNKNLFEASKNGSVVRKSLPPCPSKIHPSGTGNGVRHPQSSRFYPSILEPELLLRPGKSTHLDPENGDAFRQNDLIESPPPISDAGMPFKQSSMRPITLYQFEPFTSKSGATFNHRSSMARNLSLSDLLEQCNVFEDCGEEEEFSDQTLVNTDGTLPPTDTGGDHTDTDKEVNPSSHSSSNCILVDIGSSTGETPKSIENIPRMAPSASSTGAIRCSGLDCICDRCIQHRFKLLNWLLPNCTRINAERLLHGRMEGTFLVRLVVHSGAFPCFDVPMTH